MQVQNVDRSQAERVERPNSFDGVVHMQAIKRPADETGAEVLAVFFDAGARTRAHTHPHDQVLHVVEGNGVVATEDERLLVGPGDIVIVPAGVWHWHGATPDTAMCHISMKALGDTDWDAPQKNWASYMDV
jgi:quercetin dioxygenase-like cupin family protein